MTSHSDYGGLIRNVMLYTGAAHGGWMDAGLCKAAVNNLQHALDESTHTLINVVLPVGEEIDIGATDDVFARASEIDSMQFPLTILASGQSARVVVYMRVRLSAAGTMTFRLALRGVGSWSTVTPFPTPGDPSVVEVVSTSTVDVEVFTSLYLKAETIDAMRRGASAGFQQFPSKQADGSLGAATAFLGQLEVWFKTSKNSINPLVTALHVREFVGP